MTTVDVSAQAAPKLPAGAYAALEGLQAQAKAAMMMYPTNDKDTRKAGKQALREAQSTMHVNEAWVSKIMQVLRLHGKCLDQIDAQWLERKMS
ncbi:hypothetical protein [Pseudomonas amygdali]|uniref:Uncharacterized protein n=2 Tax=Pseudomonas amygdali pv. lachrymans TaxID=53707 RepID=A0ABR5KQG1_PSEAV|nr:hypothetical protein [Pseudomonas amygdali]AXH59615.1 hypothetical protein PLA107_030800 [Pseudomonas amygdali pv. lachrymans str. M301315]KPC17045.1 Uncharacterized protein AC499_0247 [Pseudomonas amygdali pv. lachrymans]KPC18004.1 Uncharacterized protein AC499_1206 [Pseudomonas amygdali pv. lachrymans]RMT06474.1 hypothetical protein ALP54_03535 [Pseudomonas amygdali pv. lachrymans]